MFLEKSHHHWKNRRDAHYATVRPATLANGEPGVSIRIGSTFAVLSAGEFASIAGRVTEAIDAAEKPFIARFNALAEKNHIS